MVTGQLAGLALHPILETSILGLPGTPWWHFGGAALAATALACVLVSVRHFWTQSSVNLMMHHLMMHHLMVRHLMVRHLMVRYI